MGAELKILDDVQTYGVVRIHKKSTRPLYGESCEPDVIVCPVNMTSPTGAAEQLAGGFDSGPVFFFFFLKEKHTHTTMLKTQREFAP